MSTAVNPSAAQDTSDLGGVPDQVIAAMALQGDLTGETAETPQTAEDSLPANGVPLTPMHYELLNKEGIPDWLIEEQGICSKKTYRGGHAGILFPWRDGRSTVLNEKPDKPRGKNKYVWACGAKVPLILNFARLREEGPILLVEGQKQHLAVAAWAPEEYTVVGMNGCWGWSKADLGFCSGREVIAWFDKDWETNPDVNNAARKLPQKLLHLNVPASSVQVVKYPEGVARTRTDGADDVIARIPEEGRKEFIRGFLTHVVEPPTEPLVDESDVYPHYNKPYKVAQALQARFWSSKDEATLGAQTLKYFEGDFYTHVGSHWDKFTADMMTKFLYAHLGDAVYAEVNGDGTVDYIPWDPTKKKNADTVDAIKGVFHAADVKGMPCWLNGLDRKGIISCRNVLVDPLTGNTAAHTPLYFNAFSLPFDFDPKAACPRWEAFLEDAFPGDQESKDLLGEWFGYVLSGRVDLQKYMFLKGLPRSGKGIIARMIGRLLGGAEKASGPLFSKLASDFTLGQFVGRTFMSIGDARSSKHLDMQAIVETILTVTGADPLEINRKYGSFWAGILPTRLMLLSNELPWFKDASGALMKRTLLLVFNNSFAGRENFNLEEELATELPGILNWAIKGYQRLDANKGKFTEPAAAHAVREELEESVSPVGTWLKAECTVGKGEVSSAKEMFTRWSQWAEGRGIEVGSSIYFSKAIRNAAPIESETNGFTTPEGKRVTAYRGVSWMGREDGAIPVSLDSEDPFAMPTQPGNAVDLLRQEMTTPDADPFASGAESPAAVAAPAEEARMALSVLPGGMTDPEGGWCEACAWDTRWRPCRCA